MTSTPLKNIVYHVFLFISVVHLVHSRKECVDTNIPKIEVVQNVEAQGSKCDVTVKINESSKSSDNATKWEQNIQQIPEECRVKEEEAEWNDNIDGYDNTLFREMTNIVKREISFPDIPVFAPTDENGVSELCRQQSSIFLKELHNFKMWALMMHDSTGKLPSGLIDGNMNQVGHFDQCLKVSAMRNKNGNKEEIYGKYCLAGVDMTATADKGALRQALHAAEVYRMIPSTNKDPTHAMPRSTTIDWGLCIPAGCSSNDVQIALQNKLIGFNETSGIHFDVFVDSNDCVDKNNMGPPINIGTYIVSFILIFFSVITVYATVVDKSKVEGSIFEESTEPEKKISTSTIESKGKLERIVLAFSLKQSLSELLKPAEKGDGIASIHAFKTIFCILLYYIHKGMLFGIPPYYNRNEVVRTSENPFIAILRGGALYNDGFIFLSGLIMAQSLTREITKNGRIAWWQRIITRYVRLTGPLLVLVMMYAYLLGHLGSGPHWYQVVGQNAENCRKYGWLNVINFHNILNFEDMCAPHTNHLALDTQLSLVAPAFIYFLYHFEFLGFFTISLMAIVSGALRYVTVFNYDLSMTMYHGMSVKSIWETGTRFHIKPVHRSSAYLIGILVGYLLQKHSNYLRNKMNQTIANIGCVISFLTMILLLTMTSHMCALDYKYDRHTNAMFSALVPIIGPLAVAWVLSMCFLGYGGAFNKFLSRRPFVLFSRISFAVYLLHILVFNHIMGSTRSPQFFSLLSLFTIAEPVTLIISTLFTLMFDYPVRKINAILTEKQGKLENNAKAANEDSSKKIE